jgi:polysaccharide export outer membrane protein
MTLFTEKRAGLLLIAGMFLLSGCFNTRPVKYFADIQETTVPSDANPDYLLQPNDIVSIFVSSLDAKSTEVFNIPNTFTISSATTTGVNTNINGYLINSEGNIQMPLIGTIKAAGITKKELKESITKIINDKKLLVEPIVHIRHLNYEVTVLGEVGKPTVISVPNERITMLKALGMAGDVTIYGNKESVLLIRERDGKKQVTRVNLNAGNFIQSPYYYLQPNDVVYVEPNPNKLASTSRGAILLPVILSTFSFVVVVVAQFIR